MELAGSLLIGLVLGLIIGLRFADLRERIAEAQERADIRRQIDTPAASSRIVEPELTPAEKVVREQEELIERLNPS